MTGAIEPPEERERALYRVLADLTIRWTSFPHAPVFTVEEAQVLHGSIPGGHTKNMFLKDRKDGLWLVVLREAVKLDLGALARQLDVPRFSFASTELLAEVLGVPPGTVTPFALMNDRAARVHVVLDEVLLALDPLNFHPLRNDRTTAIAPKDLLRFLEATGHPPRIVPLPERGN